MSNRLQVGSGVREQQLDVTAAPVNTFNPNAANAAGDKLAQLAQGLSTIAPEISRFAEIKQTQANDKQTAAGVAAGVEFARSGKKYADAVKAGEIPQVANPYFMMAFHEQLGRVVGDQEHRALVIARKGDENLQTTTDQADFDAFDAKHHEQWMKDNVSEKDQNSSFSTGYTSRQQTYMQSDAQMIANEIASRIGKQSNDAQHDEQMTNIQQNVLAGKTSEDIAEDLNYANEDLINTGRKPAEVMATTVKVVYDAALQDPQHGMAILESLKHIKGAFGPLSNTTAGNAAYVKGREDVGQLVAAAHKLENQQRDEATSAAVDDSYRKVAAARAADPHANITDIQTELAKVSPKEAASLAEFARNLQGTTIVTNDAVQSDLLMGIYTEGGETTTFSINDALKKKQITWQTAAEDYQKLDEYEKMKGVKGPLDPQYNRALGELKTRFAEGGVFTAVSGARFNQAQGTFTADFAAFLNTEEGKKAGWKEKNEWFVHEADAVAKQFSGSFIQDHQTKADLSGKANRGAVAPVAPAPVAAAPAATTAKPIHLPSIRVVPLPDLIAFGKPEKPNGPPSQFISDGAKAAAAKYGITSQADLIAFMHSQINTNP